MKEFDVDAPHALDAVVTAAAVTLMAVTVSTSVELSQRVLADLMDHFDVDVGYLRYNDHTLHASRLVAEWPPRSVVPDPDPLAVVYFADADPVFAQCEHLQAPVVVRPQPETDDYQRLVESGSGVIATSTAAVPLISGDLTTGTLGFIKFGDRQWKRAELNALQAIASLFTQVQARILAEEQLRYLAHHDELTGLYNRRGLLTHLTERSRRCDPIAVLFLDLDQLKNVNDDLGHAAGDDVLRVVAHRLRDVLRPADVLARLGGDEFVVSLVTPISSADAGALSEQIHATLAAPIHLEGVRLCIGVSIGVLIADHDAGDPEQILHDADTAMYAAKNTGRGKTHCIHGTDPSDPHHLVAVNTELSGDGRDATCEIPNSTMVHQAIGVLRGRSGNTADEAFAALTAMSRSAGTDVMLIACHLVNEAARRAQTTGPIT